jgi:hypothetical protein
VKDLSSRRAGAILFAPVLLLLGLVFVGVSNEASSATVGANQAVVTVAFSSTFSGNDVNPEDFQRVLLNVISVRLNASTKVGPISDFAAGWVTIGVPAGVGGNTGAFPVNTGNNFGGNSVIDNQVTIGAGRSEVQLDLGAIENIATIFNAKAVAAKTYRHVELVLDSVTPGNVVPLCPSSASGPAGEGCVSYKAQIVRPTPSPPAIFGIQTDAIIDLSKGTVTPLLIQIDPGVQSPPASFNQAVAINPTICVPGLSAGCTPIAANVPQLAAINGVVTDNVAFSRSRPVSITALNAGTNNIVLTQNLPNSCRGKKICSFVMSLPATFASAGGTNYDFVASGTSTSYAVVANVNLSSGMVSSLPHPFAVTSRTTASFAGRVQDACNGTPVQAATLNLLVPDTTIPGVNCAAKPPTGCVVAASGSSDEIGTFPLPGTLINPAPFTQVPLPPTGTSYQMVTTAAGYDRTAVTVTKSGTSFACDPTTQADKCNIALPHGILTGNVTLGGGDTGQLSVLVAAEDSGTNNIENLTFVTIPSGATTAPFTMNVPDDENQNASGETITTLDLFASTQDLFNGAPQQATGHTFAVAPDIDSPAATTSGCMTASQTPNLSGMTCVGHGSISGSVAIPAGAQPPVPPSTDTVVLSKDDVQIETTGVTAPGLLFARSYALCAPADPAGYTLTRYEVVPTPTPTTPTPTPTGTPAPYPTPTAISSASVTLSPPVVVPSQSACPGICLLNPNNSNSGCLICQTTIGPSGL